MSIMIKGMEIPKSCYECKLDLRSDVCSAFCEWNAEHPYSIRATDRLPGCPLSEVPECEDAVPRTSIEYICQKNTVSTNPYEHKYHDKFIKFMDDPEISDFGRWQHSNGFNTALVAVKCDLDKVPPVTPKQPECHEIGYRECADAVLKMWMDNVLTDGEYNRIINKLNAKWAIAEGDAE